MGTPIQRRVGDKPAPLKFDLTRRKETPGKIVFGARNVAVESIYIEREAIAPFGDNIRVTIEAI
jgi:hypothetical protein